MRLSPPHWLGAWRDRHRKQRGPRLDQLAPTVLQLLRMHLIMLLLMHCPTQL